MSCIQLGAFRGLYYKLVMVMVMVMDMLIKTSRTKSGSEGRGSVQIILVQLLEGEGKRNARNKIKPLGSESPAT